MCVKVATTSYRYTEAKLLTVPLQLSVVSGNKQETVTIGTWDMDTKWRQDPGYDQARVKRFFSVGTVARPPWTQLGEDGQLGGYCPDMVRRMAEEMGFEYELLLPSDGSNHLGRRNEVAKCEPRWPAAAVCRARASGAGWWGTWCPAAWTSRWRP